jgi:hypothetical protein
MYPLCLEELIKLNSFMSPQIIQSIPKQHPGMMRTQEVFPKLNDRFILFNMTLFSDTPIVSRNFLRSGMPKNNIVTNHQNSLKLTNHISDVKLVR